MQLAVFSWQFAIGLPADNCPLSTANFFSPDLQSVINTPLFFCGQGLQKPKVCVPLQPANEVADCSSKASLK
jgi:hypothetical protein